MKYKGFSLIELLIVITIIGVIAAVAIPNLLSARTAANESSAISSLRTFHGAQATYQTTYGNGNYAGTVGSVDGVAFSELGAVTLIDTTLASGTKSGYSFTGGKYNTSGGMPASFCGRGVPIVLTGVTATGDRNFAVATDGVVYQADSAVPSNAGCTMSGSASVSSGTPLAN